MTTKSSLRGESPPALLRRMNVVSETFAALAKVFYMNFQPLPTVAKAFLIEYRRGRAAYEWLVGSVP